MESAGRKTKDIPQGSEGATPHCQYVRILARGNKTFSLVSQTCDFTEDCLGPGHVAKGNQLKGKYWVKNMIYRRDMDMANIMKAKHKWPNFGKFWSSTGWAHHKWKLERLLGLPWWLSAKESTCQCRKLGFNPWVRKIPWRRKWQPTQVFLPEKSHGQRSLAGYSPWGHKE